MTGSADNTQANDVAASQAAEIARQAGATVQWDSLDEEPFFTYRDAQGQDHTVYFENGTAIGYKLNLVEKDHWAGVAIWHLGAEDYAYFPVMERWLR